MSYKKFNEIVNYINKGPYKNNWESISKHQLPNWFNNDKFGIFVHWGLYSIPEFNNEWYSRNMYIEGSEEYLHHIKTFGPHKEFGYQDFISLFKAEKFDAKQWIELFKKANAKYLIQVAEHHEGFQMYKSNISIYNAYDQNPHIDILGELQSEALKQNIKLGASSHRAEHWWFMSNGRKFPSDISDNLKKGDFYWPSMPEQDHRDFQSEPRPSEEFLIDWLERTVEIIDNYQPKLLYFDWWIQHESFKPYVLLLAAYYYNFAYHHNLEVAICYKHDTFHYGTGIIGVERGRFSELKHFTWQTETSIANNSWSYTKTLDYKGIDEIITLLVDVVSKNGNLLLNVGPKGDGSIPKYEIEVLETVGKWLDINGEAIFNSRPYLIYGEGETKEVEGYFSESKITYNQTDIRFTVNNGAIYVFVLNPKNATSFDIINLKKATDSDRVGIFSNIKNVTLLGSEEKVEFEQTTKSLNVKINKHQNEYPICFKVEVE